jgi:hypothetical protein
MVLGATLAASVRDDEGLEDFNVVPGITDVPPELEQSFRDAIAAGDDGARADLVQLLLLQGRMTEAEQLLNDVVQAGEVDALIAVAMVIGAQSGRKRDAERTFRLAAVGGHAEAWLLLGALLSDEPGREADAETAYRAAIEGGVEVGWCGLATVLTGEARREALAACPLEWWPE